MGVLDGEEGEMKTELRRLRADLAIAYETIEVVKQQDMLHVDELKGLRAERDALLTIMVRCAAILRGSEDEDQGAAYDNAQRVLDAAIDAARRERCLSNGCW
jgi:GTPase